MSRPDTPLAAISFGFWQSLGDWTPATPKKMAEIALLALEREGWVVVKRDVDKSHAMPQTASEGL